MSVPESPDPPLAALLARFRQGDTEALAAIFDATAPGLFRSALHLAPDAASAEDALQETFLAFIEAARGGAAIREVGPWLAGTLRNKVLRGRRDDRRIPDALKLEPKLLDDDPSNAAARAEEVERVHRALDELPETYREVAVLRWRYGMEPAAIAHARGMAPGTVRSLLSRAAERLRVGLGALGVVFVGVRPERGLAAIRGDVMRVARLRAPVAAGTAATVVGGAVMAKKVVAACAILVLLLVGGWFAAERLRTKDAPPVTVVATEPPPTTTPAARARTRVADASPVEETAPAAAAPSVREAFPRPSPSGTLVVRAVWEDDGRPAAGVWVKVHPWDGPDPFLLMLRKRTDSEGVAQFPAVYVGRAGVDVEPGGAPTPIVEADQQRDVVVRVPRGHLIEGTVVNAKGSAVPGATVYERGIEIASSGADGSFAVRIGDNGARLAARAPGHGPSGTYSVQGPAGATTHLTVVLPDGGGSVTGRVLDADGHPLAGARVRVGPWNTARCLELADGTALPCADAFETATDADGRFRVDGVEPVKTVVHARAQGLAPGGAETEVAAGKTSEVDVVLGVGGSIVGTVKDAGGVAIRDAIVLAGPYGDFQSAQCHTDAEGRYRLGGLLPYENPVSAEADGKGKASASIAVRAGEETAWNPVLTSGSVTAGRVLDGDGRPRAKWLVQIAPMQMGLGWSGSAVTDAEGRFSVENCPADFLRVEVFGAATGGDWPRYPSAIRADVHPGSSGLDVTVLDRDLPSAFVAGTVLDADGRPCEGVEVRVRHPEAQMTPYHFADPATGKFRVGPLPPAAYEVTVVAKGHPDVRLGTKDVKPGEELDLGTIRLVTGGLLEVKGRREGGGAVTRVWGEVFTEDGASAGYLMGDGDTARCAALPPGRYRVRVNETVSPTETWIALATVEVRAGETTSVDATLVPAGLRTFTASLLTGGAPKGNVHVAVRTVAGAPVYDMTTPLSAKRAASLAFPPGSYVAVASTPDGLRDEARFDVAAPGTSKETVQFVLR